MLHKIRQTLITLLRSPRFFYGIVALLILQALWFAFTAVYPMAFDEQFHFGLIQIYATQWGPLLLEAPPDSGEFGALTRDPSYLYHYLMSFPHRLFAFFVASETAQIIFLRLLNIGFFVVGLWLFRQLFLRIRVSPAMTHFILLVTILIPITPMLAAHINYDNLLFLIVPLVAIITLNITDVLRQHHRLAALTFLSFVLLCLFASLVKYAFLPVFVAAAGYIIYVWWRLPAAQRLPSLRRFLPSLKQARLSVVISLFLGLVVVGGLFLERYGGNIVQYQMITPQCERVMDFEHCSQYGVWMRNYTIAQNPPEYIDPNPLHYAIIWYYNMNYRLFFAINADYVNEPPLPIPFMTALLVGIAGILLFAVYGRRLFRQYPVLWLFFGMVGLYTVSIFLRGYMGYTEHGRYLALNGRYFIPLMPFILLFVGLATRELIMRFTAPLTWKVGVATVALLLLLPGGGMVTHLIRSDGTWYWPHETIIDINYHTQKAISPFVPLQDVDVPPST